jgi:photosystem II stability/assembly factor-like uncharacterized protein
LPPKIDFPSIEKELAMFERAQVAAVALLSLSLLAVPAAAKPKKADLPKKDAAVIYDESLFKTLEWRNIGPFRGGRSTAVAGIAGEPFTFYFGSTGGGLWKTTDAGGNWRNVSDGFFKTGTVGAIQVAPSDSNVVWVGMGESPVRGVMTTHGDGVYRSTDGGQTWKPLGLADSRHISRIQVHPNDPDTAWVAVQGHLWGPNDERGVYKTQDGGKTWNRILFVDADTGANDLVLDTRNPRVLYAAMWQHRRYPWKVESGGKGSGIHKSVDGGETWERLSGGLPETMGKVGIAVSPAMPQRIWAIVEAEKGGLYRSDDGGKKWQLINPDQQLRARSWYYMHIFADPKNAEKVWVLNAPTFRSLDGGKTFSNVRVPHGDCHDLWINPDNPNILIEGNDGGATVSLNDGRTWSSVDNQPTSQIYRVITDNQQPYRVYGGQQDNTSISIASRSTSGAITERDWHDVGGCESAYVAFDPNDPRYVYAGCYQGGISVWDRETRRIRDIMAYPDPALASEPAQGKYRFNWNAPILASPHDPRIIYHAGNKVLETRDRGRSWREISPDLTRNDKARQGKGGGPFTNEGAGGEVYNTITTLVGSPHEGHEGVLWSGSDDGKVFRRQGEEWVDVTPAGVGEALINAIEVSPHDPAKVYLAVTRYKFDVLQPIVLRTVDQGKTWTSLADGLPADTIVRVVREDPTRRGLLYLGTENGFYVSWDDGARWQKLQLNLPIVPITDLRVHGGDLVASTQGRAFWILDDLSPLRLIGDQTAKADVELMPIRAVTLLGGFRGFAGPWGTNPHTGAIMRYYLAPKAKEEAKANKGEAKVAEEAQGKAKDATADKKDDAKTEEPPLVLEILDAGGEIVRRASFPAPEGDSGEFPLSTNPGLNQWVWDLTVQAPASVPGVTIYPASGIGHIALPGRYTAVLRRGEKISHQEFELLDHPKAETTAADLAEHRELVARIRDRIHAINDTANRLADAKAQVAGLLGRLQDGMPGVEDVRKAGKELEKALETLDDKLVQRKNKGFQDIINFPPRHNSDWSFLYSPAFSAEAPVVTQGMKVRFADLDRVWMELAKEADKVLGPDLQAFEALLRQHAVPAVILKKPAPLLPEPSKPKDEAGG